MSKKCINCGMELDDAAVFCDECGTRQTAQPVSQGENMVSSVPQKSVELTRATDRTEKKIKSSGLGIASFVMGILSLCTLGILVIPEIIGLILGIVDMTNKEAKHGLTVAGIACSVVAALLLLALMVM